MARSIALLIIGAFYRMIIIRNKLILIFKNYYKVTRNYDITEYNFGHPKMFYLFVIYVKYEYIFPTLKLG